MRNLIRLLAGVMVVFYLQACGHKHAKNYNKTVLTDTAGISFIKKAAESCLVVLKASGIALTNSNNQKVIGFAKMMINDHTKAAEDLKRIENNYQLPETDTLTAEHQKLIADISAKHGATFDRKFMQLMMEDHEQAAKLFTSATANNNDDIKNFANKTLPLIKTHLDSAKTIMTSIK